MQLRRKFFDFLVGWRDTRARECLLVKGARQVGKSWLAETLSASEEMKEGV